MASPIAKLFISLGLDDSALKKGAKGVKGEFSELKKSVLQGVGIGAGANVYSLAIDGIKGVANAIGDAVGAASEWSEANSKVGVVFGTMAEDVREFASTSAETMGMAEGAALSALGTFGNFTQALGLSEAASVDMSESMVQLAADLGSFNNVGTEEVLLALRSGLSGEAEPMRRFGVALSETAVTAHLLKQGIESVNGKFTEAQKVTARYELIMQQTSKAQGDFARTADGLANKQKTLDASLTNLSTNIGKALLPVVSDVTDLFADFTAMLVGPSSASQAMQTFTDRIYGVRPAMEDAAAATGEWKDGLGDLEHAVTGTPLGLLMPGFKEEIELWQKYGEQISKTGVSFGDFVANLHHSERDLGMSREAAIEAALAWAEYGKGVNAAFDIVKSIQTTAGQTLFPTLAAPDLRVFDVVRELTSTVGIAINDAAMKLKAPFATFAKDAPETVKQTFAEIRQEIKQGFGSVKDALQGGNKIIDPETRMKNMNNRLREASKNLKRAIEVGDPFGISYWRGAVDKQRVNLQDYRRQTDGTYSDVKRDSTTKAKDTADNVIGQGRRIVRELGQLSLYEAGLHLMKTWQAGISAGTVNFFPGGVPSMTAPASAYNYKVEGRGGVSITVNGLYGGPQGLRELERLLRKASRIADRDRG